MKSIFEISLLVVVAAPFVQSLDLTLQGFTCDETLPIYAIDLSMKCNGGNVCTFGETATMYGERE